MNRKTLILLIAATIAIVGFGVFAMSRPTGGQIVASQDARVQLLETEYAWGDIDYDGGNVERNFTIKNTGTTDLALTNVATSCMCTNARITINGVDSPYFSMHSQSRWVGTVPPGADATLAVIFDPAFHGPSGVGPITRVVTIDTNDAQHPKLEFQLTGTVIKK